MKVIIEIRLDSDGSRIGWGRRAHGAEWVAGQSDDGPDRPRWDLRFQKDRNAETENTL